MSDRRTYTSLADIEQSCEIACPECGGHSIQYHEKVTIVRDVELTARYVNGGHKIQPALSDDETLWHDYHWKNVARYVCSDCGKYSSNDDVFIRPIRRD
jgi:DNA-directed RNA polymerase subunit RPC12/RpoP